MRKEWLSSNERAILSFHRSMPRLVAGGWLGGCGVWGPAVLARRSGLLAAGGLGMALLIPHPVVAIVGYALFGAGLSCIFPIVLRAAGHLENIQAAAAIAAVSTLGYTGFLAGPPMIGFLAEWLTLRGALGVVVMLTFLIAVVAGSIQQRNSPSP